jgi:hypothetical protein
MKRRKPKARTLGVDETLIAEVKAVQKTYDQRSMTSVVRLLIRGWHLLAPEQQLAALVNRSPDSIQSPSVSP